MASVNRAAGKKGRTPLMKSRDSPLVLLNPVAPEAYRGFRGAHKPEGGFLLKRNHKRHILLTAGYVPCANLSVLFWLHLCLNIFYIYFVLWDTLNIKWGRFDLSVRSGFNIKCVSWRMASTNHSKRSQMAQFHKQVSTQLVYMCNMQHPTDNCSSCHFRLKRTSLSEGSPLKLSLTPPSPRESHILK